MIYKFNDLLSLILFYISLMSPKALVLPTLHFVYMDFFYNALVYMMYI